MYFKGTGHVALYCKAIGVTVFAYGLTCCAGILPTYCARCGLTRNSYSAMIKRRQTNDPSEYPIFISLHSGFYDFQQRECNWPSLSIFSAPILRKNFPLLTEKGIWMSTDGGKKKPIKIHTDGT